MADKVAVVTADGMVLAPGRLVYDGGGWPQLHGPDGVHERGRRDGKGSN